MIVKKMRKIFFGFGFEFESEEIDDIYINQNQHINKHKNELLIKLGDNFSLNKKSNQKPLK